MFMLKDVVTTDAIPFAINQSHCPQSGFPSPDPDAFKILWFLQCYGLTLPFEGEKPELPEDVELHKMASCLMCF